MEKKISYIDDDGIRYKLGNGVLSCEGPDGIGLQGELKILAEIDGVPVTVIDDAAFYGCSCLIGQLLIPSSVISIGEVAFNDCSGFTGILIIPPSVSLIGDGAFDGCSGLSEIQIPKTCEIENDVFWGCTAKIVRY